MKIVTFNLRSNLQKDEKNNFRHRIGMIYEKIKEELPEVMAFQEVGVMHLDMLTKLLPEYTFVGNSRKPGIPGEGLFTAFRKDAFEMFSMEIFWLGPDPYDPRTRFEGQSVHPRMCVRTLLRHTESGKLFRIFNVHTDHASPEVAVKGFECVLEQALQCSKQMPAGTVILGDLNAEPHEGIPDAAKAFTAMPVHEATENISVTFHNYGRRQPPAKIDYIFISEDLKDSVSSVTVWDDAQYGIYLSDHYPVEMELA